MAQVSIPEGYQQVMPYLILENAQHFFPFIRKVFGATEKYKTMRDETRIAHAEARVGGSIIMYASSTENWRTQTAGMFVYVENADETYEVALSEGAVSIMAMSDQSYGRTGGVTDPFGNVWWITSAPENR